MNKKQRVEQRAREDAMKTERESRQRLQEKAEAAPPKSGDTAPRFEVRKLGHDVDTSGSHART